ncbi:MAG: ABC transporter ATP-binding protein [Paracoccaceae bacterium]
MDDGVLLDVDGLAVDFASEHGPVRAVDGVSLAARAGRTLAVVGESGCGKSVTSLALMGLLPPSARVTGRALFRGADLTALSAAERRAMRGRDLAMIFQEPMTALNPVYRVGDQIAEGPIRRGMARRAARERALEMLRLVRIPAPEARLDAYPHELSGGMRQRVMIAMALVSEPALLIADEPTTALDVTIQAQILELIASLQERLGMGVILITHDLGVVAETADDVAVMYAGRVVESGPVAAVFDDPQHPYTLGLMASVPRLDEDRARLATIEGAVPAPRAMPAGCRFAPRCPLSVARCSAEAPLPRLLAPGHAVACHRAPVEEAARAAEAAE